MKICCKLEYLQRTGSFKERGASVVEIAHDRAFASDDISTVSVHCIVETRDAGHIALLRERLNEEGFHILPTQSAR